VQRRRQDADILDSSSKEVRVEPPSQSPPGTTATSPELAAFEGAYLNFLHSLQALATGSGLQEQLSQSYAEYHRALGGGIPDDQAQRTAAEAYARHIELLQRALSPEYLRQRTGEVFQQYLQAVKAAWTRIDERTVPPAALVAIGQSMSAVAMTTAGVIGPSGLPPVATPAPAPR
jgi:hypothetical protein